MRNEDHRAVKVLQRFQQHVFCAHIQVVGRLVEQQKIRRAQQHARQRVAIALAARKHADPLEHIVLAEEKTAEQAAQLDFGCCAARRRSDRPACVRRGSALCIDPARSSPASTLWPSVYVAGGQRLRPGQQLDQRRLAGAVHADQRDTVAALDDEAGALEKTSFSP